MQINAYIVQKQCNSPVIYKKAGSLKIAGFGARVGITHRYLVPFIGIDTVMLVPLALWPGRSPSNNSSSLYDSPFTSHTTATGGLVTHSNTALVFQGKRMIVIGEITNSKKWKQLLMYCM